MNSQHAELQSYLRGHPRFALGFSGGSDSAFLLHAALSEGADVLPIIMKTAFVPEWETEDAISLARDMGAKPLVLDLDILSVEGVAANSPERCYLCKRAMFSCISEAAASRGYDMVADGTNASDPEDGRPGMRAIRELGVVSPLRVCGITKDDVRRLSKEAGLRTWDLPSNSCLATRIDTGVAIDTATLEKVDGAESALRGIGFSDLRVRTDGRSARIQLTSEQRERAMTMEGEVLRTAGVFFEDCIIDGTVRD